MSNLRNQYENSIHKANNHLIKGYINAYINALVEVYYYRKLMILSISN